MTSETKVTGVILAGGLARRMKNQDKGLVLFRGLPLVSFGIAAIEKVTDVTIINANRNIADYRQFGLPVVPDQTRDFDGPLAGILTAMVYAKKGILLVMPCDSPLVKAKHLQQLLDGLITSHAEISVAFDGKRLHPVMLALKVDLKDDLATYLANGGRKVEGWLQRHQMVKVNFQSEAEIFANINTLAELTALE